MVLWLTLSVAARITNGANCRESRGEEKLNRWLMRTGKWFNHGKNECIWESLINQVVMLFKSYPSDRFKSGTAEHSSSLVLSALPLPRSYSSGWMNITQDGCVLFFCLFNSAAPSISLHRWARVDSSLTFLPTKEKFDPIWEHLRAAAPYVNGGCSHASADNTGMIRIAPLKPQQVLPLLTDSSASAGGRRMVLWLAEIWLSACTAAIPGGHWLLLWLLQSYLTSPPTKLPACCKHSA